MDIVPAAAGAGRLAGQERQPLPSPRGRRPEGAEVLTMRPNQGIGVLVRCNRSDSRDTDHRPCSRPPDDLIGRCH